MEKYSIQVTEEKGEHSGVLFSIPTSDLAKAVQLSLPLVNQSMQLSEITIEKAVMRLLSLERGKGFVSPFLQKKLKQVFVIGDSHTFFWSGAWYDAFRAQCFQPLDSPYNSFGYGISMISFPSATKNPFFKVFNLGAALAFNLNTYDTTTRTREKLDWMIESQIIPTGSWIISSFGEIDLRVHILKEGHSKAAERVSSTLRNYFEFLDRMTLAGFKMIVYGPIASQKDEWFRNPEFPRSGSEVERNKWTLVFNEELCTFCQEKGLPFITLFYELIDENFLTRAEFIQDECHLTPDLYEYAVRQFNKEVSSALLHRDDGSRA